MAERNHTETGIVRPDDIVERLRAATRTGDMPLGMSFDCVAVADEIEQLRIAYQQAMNTLEQAVDEIERLRAVANDLHHDATCTESFCRLCGEGVREWKARRG